MEGREVRHRRPADRRPEALDRTQRGDLQYTATGTSGGQEFDESGEVTTDGKETTDSSGILLKAHWDGAALVLSFTRPTEVFPAPRGALFLRMARPRCAMSS